MRPWKYWTALRSPHGIHQVYSDCVHLYAILERKNRIENEDSILREENNHEKTHDDGICISEAIQALYAKKKNIVPSQTISGTPAFMVSENNGLKHGYIASLDDAYPRLGPLINIEAHSNHGHDFGISNSKSDPESSESSLEPN